MRIIKLAIVIGSAVYLLASTGPSLAQSADTDADLRCVALAGYINVTDKNPDVKRGAQVIGAYFVGKLNGRDPNLNVESALEKIRPRINYDEIIKQDGARCLKGLETFMKQVI